MDNTSITNTLNEAIRRVAAYPDLVAALKRINIQLSETSTMPTYAVGAEISWCVDETRALLTRLGELPEGEKPNVAEFPETDFKLRD